jgi:membrane-associated phospholipid phosphatase
MATELEQGPIAARPVAHRAGRSVGLSTNLALSRRLFVSRRRDIRFRVLPHDLLQILNAAVVSLTLLAIINVVLDPLLFAWQEKLPRRLVTAFGYVTRFGKSDWILLSSGLFLILMLILDAGTLRARLRARRAMRSLAAFYVFASVASSGIVANLSKYAIGRARPKFFPETGTVSFDFWSGDASWASFPSGHATTAMALGVSLALLFPRLRWLFLCLGFWIAASRLFILAHYPSDMFAGCFLGGGAAWLIARVLARHRLIFGFDQSGNLIRRKGASGRLL